MSNSDREAGKSLIDHLIGESGLRLIRLRAQLQRFGEVRFALAIVAIIPIVTILAGTMLLLRITYENRELKRALTPRIAAIASVQKAAAARSVIAPLFTRPTLTNLATRLSEALTPDTHIRLLSVDHEGKITAQIDCSDPETTVTALKSDTLLGSLRMVDQAPADQGIQITLRSIDR